MRERALLGTSALLFAASATVTVLWCGSMSAMPGMEMPGGWTMSMAWMRMPGQSWPGAAATFLAMWTVMMVAMMLPSLVPMLARYRLAVSDPARARLGRLTAIVSLAYFQVWVAVGLLAYPLGVAWAAVTMQVPALARAVPIATGVVVIAAGMLQFSSWKARQHASCRAAPARTLAADAATAWRHGFALGIRCVRCCLGSTAILLACGVMDLRAMTVVTAAIAAERLLPSGVRVARGIGVLVVGTGLLLTATGIPAM